MATKRQRKTNSGSLSISVDTQTRLVAYAKKVLEVQKKYEEVYTKFETIDLAYNRFKASNGTEDTTCPNPNEVFMKDRVTPPIVISQVDTMQAYWADVFLDGYPLFPVASMPGDRVEAEQLETLLDEHATLGGYSRQLLLFFHDCAKYNFGILEGDWTSLRQYNVLNDFRSETDQTLASVESYYTELYRRDPYNSVWDPNVLPGDIARKGDYAGFIEIENRVKLKTRLNKYSREGIQYNVKKALDDQSYSSNVWVGNYRMHPQVSNYVSARRPMDEFDWDAYAGLTTSNKGSIRNPGRADNYEVFTLYARIIPSDFGLPAPQANTPQIWKMVIVNGEILISLKRVVTANDYLPVLFGQPIEDGFGFQTHSIGEAAIDFQDAAATLYNIRFAAARRAVSDRALYDAEMITKNDVNASGAAPKIPVRLKNLQNKKLSDAYHQIPFDIRGTETTLQDAAIITNFVKELRGLNNAQQGQFQKGNKSVQEWNDVMGNSNSRLRMSALLLQTQVISPLKEMLKLNIFQYGENTAIVSQETGQLIEVDIAALRQKVLKFKLSDGYTPRSKLVGFDMLNAGFQMISSVPVLQQGLGAMLPQIFAHMMQLGGVKGLDQYMPQQAQVQQNIAAAQAQEQQPQEPTGGAM